MRLGTHSHHGHYHPGLSNGLSNGYGYAQGHGHHHPQYFPLRNGQLKRGVPNPYSIPRNSRSEGGPPSTVPRNWKRDGDQRSGSRPRSRSRRPVGPESRGTSWSIGSPFELLRAECLQGGLFWEDPDFPSGTPKLFRKVNTSSSLASGLCWLRPHQMTREPIFQSGTYWKIPLELGSVGNQGLIIALSTLVTTPGLLRRVVPSGQDFVRGYTGIFRFRFWEFGSWVEVCVDDRLPCLNGRLIGLQSSESALPEFWASLLEKAYAKFYGGYDRLGEGSGGRALQDLCGGIVQSFGLGSQDRVLTYQILNSSVPRSTLIVAYILPDSEKRTLVLRHGLRTHSAYEVTGLARVRDSSRSLHPSPFSTCDSSFGVGGGDEVPLIRLRGPWGCGPWTGRWSEDSREWNSLPQRDKDLLSLRTRDHGEFWMSFADFVRHFGHLELIHIGPDDWLEERVLQPRKPWRAIVAKRRWRIGYNAGGGPEYPDTTGMNPQFVIQIPRIGSSGVTSGPKCHVVVALAQQYDSSLKNSTINSRPSPSSKLCSFRRQGGGGRRGEGHSSSRKETKARNQFYPIGFLLYEVHSTSPNGLRAQFVSEKRPLDVTPHASSREVATFFALPPGDYVIVPQTRHPNCETKFLLRIFTDEESKVWEVNEDNILYRNFSVHAFENTLKPIECGELLERWRVGFPPEIDPTQFRRLLKHTWRLWRWRKPSLELCKSLIMLRDSSISGRLVMKDLPPLISLLLFWKNTFEKWTFGGWGPRSDLTSSYYLRRMLWESGIGVSNKVLECLVLQFSSEDGTLGWDSFLMALLRLHLAHERYGVLENKMISSPISLEEMILMTIYS